MRTSPVRPLTELSPQAVIAYWGAVIAAGAAALGDLVYIYLLTRSLSWQIGVLLFNTTALLLTAMVSAWLIRRGRLRPELGVWLLFAVGEIVFVLPSLVVSGLGLILGLSVALLVAVLAPQTLPPAQARLAITTGVIAGAAALLLEFSVLPGIPLTRLPAPGPLQTALPIILAAALLSYSYFLVRPLKGIFDRSDTRSVSLRAKLILAFLVVTVATIGAVTFINDRLTRARLTDEAGVTLQTLAQSQARVIGDQLTTEVNLLRSFSLNDVVEAQTEAASAANHLSPGELNRLNQHWQAAVDADMLVQSVLGNTLASELHEFRENFPENVAVLATDRRGLTIAATRRPWNYYHATAAWWQAAYADGQGAVYIGQPDADADPSGNSLISIIAVPLYSRESRRSPSGGQELVGVLRADYNLEALIQVLASAPGEAHRSLQGAGPEVDIDLLFPAGQFVESEGRLGTLDPQVAALLSDLPAGHSQITYEGEVRLASRAPVTTLDPARSAVVADLDWKLLVSRSTAQALAPVNVVARTTLLVGLGALLAAVLAAFAVGQVLTGPIIRLTAVAAQITAGNLDAQAVVESQDEIGALAATFNAMTAQMRQTLTSLEQRVIERTAEVMETSEHMRRRAAQLETSAEVARAAASVLELRELLPQVTRLISERFGFYHAGIFLLDDAGEYAVLQAANSEGGQRMLARGHKLRVGQVGIVGHATGTGQPRITLDVGQDAVYFDNPDLPLTRSEMALPLKVQDHVIGALDVQSTQAAAFTEEDVALLALLADQIAIAIENARSFQQQVKLIEENRQLLEQAQRAAEQQKALAQENRLLFERSENAVQELRELTRRLTGEAWEKVVAEQAPFGELVAEDTQPGVELPPEGREALRHGERQSNRRPEERSRNSVSRPLRLRGEVIGTITLEDADPARSWTDDNTALLENLAERLALTLDNVRLFEDTQRRLAELSIINTISQIVAAQQDLTSLVTQVGDQILQTFGVRNGFIALYDKQRNLIEIPYFMEGNQPIQLAPVPLGRELTSIVIQTCQPLLINYNARERAAELGALLVGEVPRSFLGVPILVGEEVIGVISVQSLTREGLFTDSDVRLLTTIAANVGIGIQNVRLLAQAQRRAQREARINLITRQLRSSQTVESILETAARELGRALNVPQVAIEVTPPAPAQPDGAPVDREAPLQGAERSANGGRGENGGSQA